MINFIKGAIKRHPRRTIVLGFAAVILTGSLLLMLPGVSQSGESLPFLNCLFTSTSAVCVTGLVVMDVGDSFNVMGEAIVAFLIQIGGLGITSIGVIAILIASGKVTVGSRKLATTALNLSSEKGVRNVIKAVLYVTLITEGIGAACSFVVFASQYKLVDAIGISIFHAIASFNNAGFDIFGGFKNLADYHDNVWINLVTASLIIMGGIGFFVIMEVVSRKKFKDFSLHTKVVLMTTGFLIVAGTIGIKLVQDTTWLAAFFHSVSCRTAGFSTENMATYSSATLMVMVALMFIGASPGSTGGGIKTTTLFVIWRNLMAVATNHHCKAFKRSIPGSVVSKAMVVMSLGLATVFLSTTLLSIFEPSIPVEKLLFEVTSAFGTVGLSAGLTPTLTSASKIILILTMFVGRVGPLTLITLWERSAPPMAKYTEEIVTIG